MNIFKKTFWTNPYELIWYKQGWSKTRIEKNNANYWKFEIEHNGLTLP